jgi:hypothetical protein
VTAAVVILSLAVAALLGVVGNLSRPQLHHSLDAAEQQLQDRRGGRHARAFSRPRPLLALRGRGRRTERHRGRRPDPATAHHEKAAA